MCCLTSSGRLASEGVGRQGRHPESAAGRNRALVAEAWIPLAETGRVEAGEPLREAFEFLVLAILDDELRPLLLGEGAGPWRSQLISV